MGHESSWPIVTIYLRDLLVDICPMPTTRRRISTHAVVATDAQGRVRTWDAAAAAMFGRDPAQALGRRVAEIVAADTSTVVAVQAMQSTMRGESWTGSLAICHSGSATHGPVCHVTVSPVIDEEGTLLSVVWTFVDVRAERRTDNALRRLTALIDSTGDAVVSVSPDGIVTSWNNGAAQLWGHSSLDVVGQHASILAPPQRASEIERVLDAVRGGAPRVHYDATGLRSDGSRVEIRITVVPVLDPDGGLVGMTAMARDITPLRQLERTLSHRDAHDELTGLPNRRTVEGRLQAALASAQTAADGEVAVLFIDVDRFATVNNAWGHAAGDVLLAEIAERLRRAVRGGDVIARFGGDEFVVVCERMSTDLAEDVAERVHRLVAEPVLLNGHSLSCTVSVGVALSPSYDAQTLLRDAAAAAEDAKARGRDCTRVYDAELAHRAKTRLDFASDLREALLEDKLELRY